MSCLIVQPEPLPRASFLGELQLFICRAMNEGEGIAPYVYAFYLLIQGGNDPEAEFQKLTHGACELVVTCGEPYGLEFMIEDGEDGPVGHIRQHTVDLAYFVGDELASELAAHMIDQYQQWVEEGMQFGPNTSGLWLQFTNMRRYNEVFLGLCEQIASETGTRFDRQSKVLEIMDYWFDASADWAWCDENGPAKERETPADLETDLRRCKELVLEGQRAARELVSAENGRV